MPHIDFQTPHYERSERMNNALLGVSVDLTNHKLTTVTDVAHYDSAELVDTIKDHISKGVQNIKVECSGEHYAMVVEPINKTQPTDGQLLVEYRIVAYTRD